MFSSPKKVAIPLLLIAALGTAGVYGLRWYQHGRYIETTDNAYVKADSVALRPEIAGRIKQVAVVENQRVKQGDLLIQLDPADYEAQLAQAGAESAVAQAALVDVQEQVNLQHKKLDESRASIEAAKAELQRTRLELQRAQTLVKQSFGSQQRLENAEADAEVAKARLAQANAVLAAEQQMLAVFQAKQESAIAQIAAAQAHVAYARHQLKKTTILAPADGIIGNLGAHSGGYAQPAQTLLQLVPLPQVYVVANFKETQIGHMSIGQPVSLKVDAMPDVQYDGVVESLSPATGTEFSLLPQDNATGNFNKIVQRVPVRIRVTGPAENLPLLRPGLSVIPAVNTEHFQQQVSYLNAINKVEDGIALRAF